MTLAIGTSDGVFVSEHLARSLNFLLYSVDGAATSLSSTVVRGTDECGNHRSFTELLAGCEIVLCGGVGQGAVDALAAALTRTIVLARPYRIDEALAAFLDGTLETTDARVCLCGPNH